MLAADASVGVHPEALLRWAEAPNRMRPEWVRWLSLILCILAIAGAVVWGAWSIATPLIVILVVEAILRYRLPEGEEFLAGVKAYDGNNQVYFEALHRLQLGWRNPSKMADLAMADRAGRIAFFASKTPASGIVIVIVPVSRLAKLAAQHRTWRCLLQRVRAYFLHRGVQPYRAQILSSSVRRSRRQRM